MGIISRFFVWATLGGTKRTALVDTDGHPQVDVLSGTVIVSSGDVTTTPKHSTKPDNDNVTAVVAAAAAVELIGAEAARLELVIQNEGDNDLYLGKSGATASSYSVKLSPGDSFSDDRTTDAWYGFSTLGTSAKVFSVLSSYA